MRNKLFMNSKMTEYTSKSYFNVSSSSGRLRKMTRAAMALLILAGTVSLVGCEKERLISIDLAPPAPQGLYTVRGDNSVTVYWLPVEAADFDHYRVYRGADSGNGSVFNLLGTTGAEMYIDDAALNSFRYYYIVTAVDVGGNESLESAEWGGATPRVDRFNVTLVVSDVSATGSGFDLSLGDAVAFNDPFADIWIDRDGAGILYINADTIADPSIGDIQDMGFTSSLDEIAMAPQDGWSALGYYEIVEGHTYIIWTEDDHYAKIRVTSMTDITVTFDYAYQAADGWVGGGEPELVSVRGAESVTTSSDTRALGAHRTDVSQQPKTQSIEATR